MDAERLQIVIDVQSASLTTNIQRIQGQMNNLNNNVQTNMGNTFNGLSSRLSSIGKLALKGFATVGITSFLKSCIEAASDLQEVENVVDTTFGNMSDAVDQFAKASMKSFGLSELAAKQYAGTLGAMIKSMGFTTDQALLMSENLTALAGDIASFYNLSSDEAFGKLRSGISGETEPLKQLGINMSVANLEAYALAQGIKTSYSELDQASQAALRYNYILNATKDAQGDFSKTSDGFANSTRIMSMSWTELKGTIGSLLIDIATPLVKALGFALSLVKDLINGFKSLIGVDDESSTKAIKPLQGIAEDTEQVSDNMDTATKSAKQLKSELAGFDEINKLNGGSTGLDGGLVTNSGELINLMSAYDEVKGHLEDTSNAFGTIALKEQQIRDTAKYIIGDGNLDKMSKITKEMDKLDTLADNIKTAKDNLDSYTWQISIGMTVSESDYKTAVDTYIGACQSYITQQHKAVKLAAELYFGEGSSEVAEYNTFYNEIEGELASLSNQIKDKVNSAWSDGMITLDEDKEINNLMNQQASIVQGLAAAEHKVKLKNMALDFEGMSLDKQSMLTLLATAGQELQDWINDNKETKETLQIPLEYKLANGEVTQETYDEEMAKIQSQFEAFNAEATNNYVTFVVEAALNMDTSNIDLSDFKFDLPDIGNSFETEWNNQDFWDTIMKEGAQKFKNACSGIPNETKDGIKLMLEAMKPTTDQWEAEAQELYNKGAEIPPYLSDGLLQVNALKAITGDVSAMYMFVGNQLSDNKELTKALGKAKDKGIAIPYQFLLGLNGKKINLTNGIAGIFTTISTSLTTSNKVTTAKSDAKSIGSNITLGIVAGLKSAQPTLDETVTKMVGGVIDKTKNILGIHSPSKVFGEIGKYTMQGFANGIDDNMYESNKVMAAWANNLQLFADGVNVTLPTANKINTAYKDDISSRSSNGKQGGDIINQIILDSRVISKSVINTMQKQQMATGSVY